MDTLPSPVSQKIQEYLSALGARCLMVSPRKSCHGTWTVCDGKQEIKINNNLSGIQFMLTLVHEIAHGYTWNIFGDKVKPHGKEWKEQYRLLMSPLLHGYFDTDTDRQLREYMVNPSSSSGTSVFLRRITNSEQLLVEDAPMEKFFKLKNGLMVKKIKKLRTRWLVEDTLGKQYYTHASSFAFF